jgi:GNAT superfamily N-acetyltransferase
MVARQAVGAKNASAAEGLPSRLALDAVEEACGMTTTTDLRNGYYMAPVGKLVNAVTWLEMLAQPTRLLPAPLRLIPVTEADQEACLNLFAAIGTPWLWSRAFDLSARQINKLDIHFALDDTGHRVGVVEFSGRSGPEVEIAFFGLVMAAIGGGLGRRMMAAALDLAWRSADRVWLHTCSFDHPSALRFYLSFGFTPYAMGFEILDDPRLDGSLPRAAAPHVPLIDR